jgi:hypothetical protein
MRPNTIARRAAGALLVALAAAPLAAQSAGARAPLERRNVLSINPLGIPFEYFSAEYEGTVAGAFTLGGNVSYFAPGDASYTSFEVKGRLYPNEVGPKGFSVGMGLGVAHVSEEIGCFDCSSPSDRTATRPTIHVFTDYNWLLGKSGRFYVGTGVGAKRILGLRDRDYDDILQVYPTFRFQIGTNF